MDADSITLDNSTFKALASQTRVGLLKSLDARRKTASELSHELGATVQGISEHLHSLQQAGLVERKESGRKWVYYQLTAKGSAVLHPDSKKFWVLVSLSFLALLGYFSTPYFFSSQNTNALAYDASGSAERMALTPEGTPVPEALAAPPEDSSANAGVMAIKSTESDAQALQTNESNSIFEQGSPVEKAQDKQINQTRAASPLSSNEGLLLIAAAFLLAGAGWIKFVKKSA